VRRLSKSPGTRSSFAATALPAASYRTRIESRLLVGVPMSATSR
jgi:hypothetical protein